MKNLGILALVLFAGVSSASEVYTYVSTKNPETAQSIFALPQSNNCDADESWACETEVSNRSGTIDSSRCRGRKGNWACYEDVKESCTERGSGKKSTRSYRQFTGACSDTLSDCW